jgi:hypothetical protein
MTIDPEVEMELAHPDKRSKTIQFSLQYHCQCNSRTYVGNPLAFVDLHHHWF